MDAIVQFIENIIKAPFIICGWIIIGAIAGDLARRFMKSKDQSFIADLILGIAGAIVGGFVAGLVINYDAGGGITQVIISLIVATAGAAGLIAIRRALSGKKVVK